MPIVVHHLEKSRSHRILWLLEELGLDYQIEEYKRDPKTMLAPPELKAVHPLGKSPVVEMGGKVMAESGAIIEHLVETNGGRFGVPAGDPHRFDYLYWLHYAEGSAMTALLVRLYIGRTENPAQAMKDRVESQVASQAAWIEQSLVGRNFFAGNFSAADIQMSYPVEFMASRNGGGLTSPNLTAWLTRIRARPAYQRAIERGGPVMG